MIKKVSKTTKIVLLAVFLVLLFITFVYGEFMFMCDKVKAEVEILEDGTWHIIKILGRYEPAYEKKKSYN
jgi:hypothetical protein